MGDDARILSWRTRSSTIAAVLAAIALLVPVGSLAASLGGAHDVPLGKVVQGVWCLKAALAAVAVAVLFTPVMNRLAGPPRVAGDASVDKHSASRLLLIILAVGIAVRLQGLQSGLWLDEIDTLVDYVRLPFAQMISTYHSQNHHPLYSLLARAAYLAVGGDWSIRIPAMAFGVASLWATYWFARQVTDQRESLLATAVLAVSYHHVWFSQNARGYSALLFLTLVGSTLFIRILRGGAGANSRNAWLYGSVMAFAVYTHLTAAIVVVGHALAILSLRCYHTRGDARRGATFGVGAIALSAILAFALYALVAPQVLDAVLGPSELTRESEWTSISWLLRETLQGLAGSSGAGLIIALVAAVVCVVGVVSYWQEDRGAAIVMAAPPILTGVAVVALHHNLWPRFFFFAAAFVVLIALRGGFAIARRIPWGGADRLATVGAALIVLASAATVPRAWGPKQDYVGAAREIASLRQPGDAIVTVSITSVVYSKYLSIPGSMDPGSVDSLRRIESLHDRTYILYTFPVRTRATDAAIWSRINSPEYREVVVLPATVGDGQIHIVAHERRQMP